MRNTNVPHGWNLCKISSVLTIKHGKSQREIETADGAYPVLATGGEIGRTNTPIYTKPSVLIGRKGTIDKPQYTESPFWTVDTLFYSEIKSNIIPKYIFYLFQTINWQMFNEGSTLPSLSANTIMNIKILMPPIKEQKKIAGILGTWDRAIEELTGLIAEKKELKRGLMQRLLTGTQRLPGFTKPWKKIKLHDVAEIFKGTQLNRLNMLEEGYPVYNGGMTESGFTNEYNNVADTIIISEGGNSCGFVNFIKTKFWAGGHCYTVICRDCVNKSFLYQLLKYNENKLMNLRVGSGLPNIQQKTLNKFSLLLPCDFTEQKAIADVLFKADAEIDLLNQQLDVLKEQKRGLMQKLLTGEIRVKVDDK